MQQAMWKRLQSRRNLCRVEDLQQKTSITLQSSGPGYRLATQFHYTAPFGLKPIFDFVNSPVYVFAREQPEK